MGYKGFDKDPSSHLNNSSKWLNINPVEISYSNKHILKKDP